MEYIMLNSLLGCIFQLGFPFILQITLPSDDLLLWLYAFNLTITIYTFKGFLFNIVCHFKNKFN